MRRPAKWVKRVYLPDSDDLIHQEMREGWVVGFVSASCGACAVCETTAGALEVVDVNRVALLPPEEDEDG